MPKPRPPSAKVQPKTKTRKHFLVNAFLLLVVVTVCFIILFSSFYHQSLLVNDADGFLGSTAKVQRPKLLLNRLREKNTDNKQKKKNKIRNNPRKNDDDDRIDWSDSIFQRHGWDNDPVVLESHKLLFFTIPKNACTTFKKLFRRMMGHPDWFTRSPHDPAKNGLNYLGSYPRAKQKEFMTSENWTRAIFVRDPLERTLSAYMDKALQIGPKYWQPPVEGAHLKQLCCHLKGAAETEASLNDFRTLAPPICKEFPLFPYETPLTMENFPFESFVSKLLRQCWDSHWRPQHERMQRPKNWKVINFVGHFETIREDTLRLLQQIGAYEEFGATGWGTKLSDSDNATTTNSLSIFETNTALHKTGSSKQMDKLYTENARKLVSAIYRKDYDLELFNFTDPMKK